MGFKDKLMENLRGDLTENELKLLPRGFQTIGKAIIVKLNAELLDKKELIGSKYLEMLPSINSIYINRGIVKGQFRTPDNIEYLLGENNSTVEHKEHGIVYKFDFTKIMFSQGNLAERKFLATLVKEKEIIVDMFAGIGYFSLPIAKHSQAERIYSIELNPLSYKYLVENIKMNHFEDLITPILGDCKDEVLKLSKSGLRADRVIMGVFPAPKDYINEALTLAKEGGTIYHYEGIVEKERIMDLFNEFKYIAENDGFSCTLIDKRLVKSYGPNLYHTVLDIRVTKKN